MTRRRRSRAGCSAIRRRSLARCARFLGSTTEFRGRAGLLAIHWLVQGYGYEITGADVWAAYSSTVKNGNASAVRECVKKLIAKEIPGGFVARILGRELGL